MLACASPWRAMRVKGFLYVQGDFDMGCWKRLLAARAVVAAAILLLSGTGAWAGYTRINEANPEDPIR